MHNLLAITICLLVFETTTAQLNHVFVDSNATWCTLSGGSLGGTPPSGSPPYTLDAGRARFDSVHIDSLGRFVSAPNYLYEHRTFKEDTSQHEVYLIMNADTLLLYDMNLQTGDTFHWHPRMADTVNSLWYGFDPDTVIGAFSVVESIDTVALKDSTSRLRWHLNTLFATASHDTVTHHDHDMQWIDGIGATRGWYYPFHGVYFETWDYFTAYFYHDELMLKWGECYPVGIASILSSDRTIQVWPNPAEDHIVIDAPASIRSITVIDRVGLKVLYEPFNGATTSATFDLHSLPAGYYHLITETEQETTSTPLIKIH